ncbi:MAG: ParA family protein [Desulfuromonadales bacterium]
MDETRPFVITVASEKGGVGKTTIATNLAVYLKALREDLPVTIASFDNHFSIDQMFAIGRRAGRSVAGLFTGVPAGELAEMGEYGVQFIASERDLRPVDEDHFHLRRILPESRLPGILILDTRPILDYFTRNALLAADLVLVPVKDRPSLVNVASLLKAMREGDGAADRVWLIPSIIDARLHLRPNVGVREYLTFAARERDYQVLDNYIAKSPKVEGLATSFSSRVYPVITHARGTQVHGQLRELAEFVLQEINQVRPLPPVAQKSDLPAGRRRRLQPMCPVCREATDGREGYLFQEIRRRRLGFIHQPCLESLLAASEPPLSGGGMLAVTFAGVGGSGPDAAVALQLFTADGESIWSDTLPQAEHPEMLSMLEGATGRHAVEFHRETLLFFLDDGMPWRNLADEGFDQFAVLRRLVLRELNSSR